MAVPLFNISGYLTVIDLCDTGTGWDITDVDTDIKVEGVGAGFDAIRDGGTVGYTFGTAQDMSGADIHIRQWLMHTFPSYLQNKALGGIQLYITDGTNTAAWYVGGSDTHNGAWELFQADLSSTPDSGTLPDLTVITEFGFTLDHATAARNVVNTYWDICTFARGYEIYGGTSVDKVSWISTALADTGLTSSKQFGVVEIIKGGAFYLNSGFFIGDSLGTNDCYFDGTNKVIIFYDADEKTGLYKVVGTGNSTGVTDIDLSGASIISAGSPLLLDMSGVNVTSFLMNGAKVENASACIFKAGQEIDGTVFTDAGTFTIGGSNFDNNTINLSGEITVTSVGTSSKNLVNKATTAVAVNCTDLNDLDEWEFISDGSNHAVDLGTISSDVAMGWNCTTAGYASSDGSTGNETILVNVASGITLTINVAAGATRPTVYNTGTGIVYIPLATYSLTFTGIPVGVEYRLRQGSYSLQHQQDVVSGATTPFNYEYTADYPVTVSFTGSGIIEPQIFTIILSDTDQIIPVNFNPDPSYIA